jgi:hypothetical protein
VSTIRAFKRFTVIVTTPACTLLGTPEQVDKHIAIGDMERLLSIWDNYETTQARAAPFAGRLSVGRLKLGR